MEDNEEKPTVEEKPAVDTPAGNDPKVPSAIRLANEANQRMEDNIKKMEDLTSRNEELAADNVLGGTAEAGKGAEPVKKEESNHEYRMRVEQQMAAGTFDDRK